MEQNGAPKAVTIDSEHTILGILALSMFRPVASPFDMVQSFTVNVIADLVSNLTIELTLRREFIQLRPQGLIPPR